MARAPPTKSTIPRKNSTVATGAITTSYGTGSN